MKKYTVRITQFFEKDYGITAANEQAAINKAEGLYEQGDEPMTDDSCELTHDTKIINSKTPYKYLFSNSEIKIIEDALLEYYKGQKSTKQKQINKILNSLELGGNTCKN